MHPSKPNQISHHDGSALSEKLADALITENGTTIYKIIDDIPIMLEDQSITDFEFL